MCISKNKGGCQFENWKDMEGAEERKGKWGEVVQFYFNKNV